MAGTRNEAGEYVSGIPDDMAATVVVQLTEYVSDIDGPTMPDIAKWLSRELGKEISGKMVRGWCSRNGVSRNGRRLSAEELDAAIIRAVESLGVNSGYRHVWSYLKQECGVGVTRDECQAAVARLFPAHVARRQQQLHRKILRNNYHADHHMQSVHGDINEKLLLLLGVRFNIGIDGKTYVLCLWAGWSPWALNAKLIMVGLCVGEGVWAWVPVLRLFTGLFAPTIANGANLAHGSFRRAMMYAVVVLNKCAMTQFIEVFWPFVKEHGFPDQMITDKGKESVVIGWFCYFAEAMFFPQLTNPNRLCYRAVYSVMGTWIGGSCGYMG